MIDLTLGALFIISTVSDHVMDSHLWEHVARVHTPRVFSGTLGAFVAGSSCGGVARDLGY